MTVGALVGLGLLLRFAAALAWVWREADKAEAIALDPFR